MIARNTANPQAPAPESDTSRPSIMLCGLLLVYSAAICGICYWFSLRGRHMQPALWEFNDLSALTAWGWSLVRQLALTTLAASGAGLLAGLALGQADSFARRAGYAALALACALVLIAIYCATAVARFPGLIELLPPFAAGAAGVIIGRGLAGGRTTLPWLAAELALLVALLIGAAIYVRGQAFADEPLPFEPVRITGQRKRELVRQIRAARGEPGSSSELQLSTTDVNELLSWGLKLHRPARKAHLTLNDASVEAEASLATAQGTLNLRAELSTAVSDGRLALDIERLAIGSLEVPRPILASCARAVTRFVHRDPDLLAAIASIESLSIGDGRLTTVSDPGTEGLGFVPVLLGLVTRFDVHGDLLGATTAQVQRLVDAASEMPDGDEKLLGLTEAAFALAAERSASSNPNVENMAAVYALGILIGDFQLEEYLGRITDAALRQRASEAIGIATLRDRQDWARHFWVSAALAAVASEEISEAAGVLKEQLDAEGEGGSGFSFADLMADRAGTRFGIAATRDRDAALGMQQLISQGITSADLLPTTKNLPEGLSAAELSERFGPPEDPRYQSMIRSIDTRLGTSPILN